MSRDIRSFFSIKKVTSKKDEDSDVIPGSPDVQITNKKKLLRKKRQIQEDSEEEIISLPKKKKNSPKASLKEIKAVDLFGKAPIKRTEPIVKIVKKETEITIHSDEEFEQSLLQIDEEINLKAQSFKKPEIKIETPELNEYNSNGSQKHSRDTNVEDTTNKKRKLNKSVNEENTGHTKVVNKKTKKDFSEFVEDQDNIDNTELSNDETEPKQKKRRLENSLNESVLTDEERYERKRQSAALYQKYLNRSGPKHLGTKEIPEGTPDCLKDCSFLFTGVLDSFERDEVIAAITKYGGSIKNGISKKVTHIIAGDDAGPAKLAKAQELGIKIMNEDQFLQFIKDSLIKKTPSKEIIKDNDKKKDKSNEMKREPKPLKKNPQNDNFDVDRIKKEKPQKPCKEYENNIKVNTAESNKSNNKEKQNVSLKSEINHGDMKKSCSTEDSNSLMWVDKYKPKNLKQIIGQQGDASNVNKLSNWLKKWYVNRKAKLPKPSPWAKNDDGGYYRAALLSGPPGVGKTTTVSLVCKELGFDTVEFNASDTRSKTLIRDQIGELISSTSLMGYATGSTGKGAVSKKHALVMDEVDGMAGNEDRGGLQELISLIKSTSVPIICTCNDRNSEKMRTLVNYCYDLRFSRPRVEQIKSALMSICFKEGVKLPPEELSGLVVSSGQDVRQALHALSVRAARAGASAALAAKDVKMGPWEAIRKVFSAEEHKNMSINDKSDLFFSDYSIMPLFVQENFLNASPHCPKKEILDRLSQAAESLSHGDIVEARIRRSQAWSLLPTQAIFSSVIPGHVLSGHMSGQIQFPSWLGKNSRSNKMHRLCQEIHAHTRLSTSGSKSSIFLDYSTHLRDAITNPLIQDKTDGIEQSLKVLESYHLLREDLESLVELSLWPGQRNPTALINAKVKAAMTRTYNKKASALPYAAAAIKKGRATDDGELSHEEESSDVELDAMIKKKKKEPAKPSASKAKQDESVSISKGAGKRKPVPKQKKK